MGQCVSRKAAGALAASANASSAPYRAMQQQASPTDKKKGQGESKGATKRSTPYTRGTAMSFGFKKRAHSAIPTSTTEKGGTVIANPKTNITDNSRPASALTDNNGNSGSLDSLNATSPEQSGRSTPRLAPPRKEAAGPPLRTNRFGFRQGNGGRPALTAKVSDVITPQPQMANQSQANNNLEKPRPKTCGGQIVQTSNNTQQQAIQPKIKAPPVPVQNTQTAPIVDRNKVAYSKPHVNSNAYMQTPVSGPTQPSVPVTLPMQAGRFTLQTSSLPRPQFAVRVMESKVAKQAVNNSRKVNTAMQTGEGGYGLKEGSEDSGNGSCNGPDNNEMVPTIDMLDGSPRRVRYRPRNLEMVMRGNHNFEVRDLDESFCEDTILPLPKLPSSFSNAGLVRDRAADLQQRNQQIADPCNNPRKTSTTSCDSFQDDSCDEEKAFRDRSSSEKEMHTSISKDFSPSSKGSSPASSKASSGGRSTAWGHGGESLALREEYSLSFSSSDESKDKEPLTPMTPMMATSLTMNTGLQSLMTSSLGGAGSKQPIRNVLLTIEDPKFAAVAAAASAQSLLDDETSPVDSLISSCTDSDELISKKKKNDDTSKEKDSMEILDNVHSPPVSPGTPTNASNSLSLSDGRDFLIDDEIADQPALVFDDKKSSSADQVTSSLQLLSLTDNTITLMDSSTTPAPINILNRPGRNYGINNTSATGSPAPLKAKMIHLSRTGSLDTLSPCESIASDDLIMDYDQSSIDSDRLDSMASGSALHSLDEQTIMSELEAQGGQVRKVWTSLLGTHNRARESIEAQLPARASRLLNRSRATSSEAPRSLDSVGSQIHPARRTPTLRQPRQGVSDSPDDAIRLDRALHGSMAQDIVGIKTMLLKLKRVLQEPDEDNLKRTETLNPFDNQHTLKNGLFYQGETESSNAGNSGDDQANEADTSSRQELADLRRQVVFLQSQLEDKERTVQLLQLQMTKYSSTQSGTSNGFHSTSVSSSEESDPVVCHAATQTERLRPVSTGPSALQHALPDNTNGIVSWNKASKLRTARSTPSEPIRTIPIATTPGAPMPSPTLMKRPAFWNVRDQNIIKTNTNQSPAIIKQSTEQTLDKRKQNPHLLINGTSTNTFNYNLKNNDPNIKYNTSSSIKLQNSIYNNENSVQNGHNSLPHFLNSQNGSK